MSGKKYQFGGKSMAGFDCSGYVAHVFNHLFPDQGPRFNMNVAGYITSPLSEDVETPQIGDLIIFPKTEKYVNHIGIVESAHGWVGSQSSTGVAFVFFNNSFWSKRTHKFRRYKHVSTNAIQAGVCGPKVNCE
ncbi:MAG TPA: NlpC/P60 family protein [Limnobacter sp.]|nr:NlpC/P60 family protein [Limnobacter sp.]